MTRIALLALLLLASAPATAEGGKTLIVKSVTADAPDAGPPPVITKESLIEKARAELVENGKYLATRFRDREVARCERLKATMLTKGQTLDCTKANAVVEAVYVGAATKPGAAGIVALCVTSGIDGAKTRFALFFLRGGDDGSWALFSEDFVEF